MRATTLLLTAALTLTSTAVFAQSSYNVVVQPVSPSVDAIINAPVTYDERGVVEAQHFNADIKNYWTRRTVFAPTARRIILALKAAILRALLPRRRSLPQLMNISLRQAQFSKSNFSRLIQRSQRRPSPTHR